MACTLPYDRKEADASNTESVSVDNVLMKISLFTLAVSGNRTVKETVTLPAEMAVICTRYGSTPAELATVRTKSVRKVVLNEGSTNCWRSRAEKLTSDATSVLSPARMTGGGGGGGDGGGGDGAAGGEINEGIGVHVSELLGACRTRMQLAAYCGSLYAICDPSSSVNSPPSPASIDMHRHSLHCPECCAPLRNRPQTLSAYTAKHAYAGEPLICV
jgi:hypothetical protein